MNGELLNMEGQFSPRTLDSVKQRRARAIEAMMAPLVPLIGEAQIKEALRSLSPLALEACRVAMTRIPDIKNIKNDRQLLCEIVVTSFAMVGLPKGLSTEVVAAEVDSYGPSVVHIVYSSLDVIDGVYVSRGSSVGRWAALSGGLAGFLLSE